jgi:hypothetical protein
MKAQEAAQQIRDVTRKLMIASLVDHQHEPTVTRVGGIDQIGIAGSPDLSVSLRDIPYSDVYRELLAAGAYHLRMIDGGLIQLLYTFRGREVQSHRLAFFPSPAMESYDEAAQLYEDEELFADIFVINAVRSPLRFDFSNSEAEFEDLEHPKSHFTIGQYKNCRIPVTGPVTPNRFMRFVLRNFYHCAYGQVNIDEVATFTSFPDTITANERAILHVAA